MSNNNSLQERKFNSPLTLVSTLLVVLGFVFMANGIGSLLIAVYLGRMPVAADLVILGSNAQLVKKLVFIGQIGGTLSGLVILPLLYIAFLRKELKPLVFNPSWKKVSPFFITAITITFTIMPLIGIIGDWNKALHLPSAWNTLESGMRAMEESATQLTALIVSYNTIKELLLVLFTVAFLPAVAEELVFRGILQNSLIKSTNNIHLSVFISAAVFSFIHFQFFGFFPRMLLGIVLGYLYITSGNILVSMAMHFTNNAVVILALNLYAKGTLKIDPESSKDLPQESIYISTILSAVLFYFCWRMYKLRTDTKKTNV